MPRYDFRTPRLFVDRDLAPGSRLSLESPQENYLRNVLRLRGGAALRVFNGRDGEWHATLAETGRRATALVVGEQTRTQPTPSDLHYWFVPLKHARLDYMVQKAVEMGVARLQPVLSRHGQVARVNLGRMRANAIEAAEQCGVLVLPEITTPIPLDRAIADRDPGRLLVFCDEDADVANPISALVEARNRMSNAPGTGTTPTAVLVGPEGGFAPDERAALVRLPNVARLALGPRILRADTAAVAALALVQGVLGDWH